MNKQRPFAPTDKMRDIIKVNPFLLPVLSRFQISLGFGENSIEKICKAQNVDTQTFLTVCNYFSGIETFPSQVNLPSLIKYLESAHTFFLDYLLPSIRTKIIGAITTNGDDDFVFRVIKYYDQYVNEVRTHMNYEEKHVFTYVLDLCNSITNPHYKIEQFKEKHLPIAHKLKDLKEIFLHHYTPASGRVDMLNAVLLDLILCENDLMRHCSLEDNIFIPAVRQLENPSEVMSPAVSGQLPLNLAFGNSNQGLPDLPEELRLDDHGDIVLTPREKDIVKAIAQGLSNKQIAEKLFVSIHTVTTHRRNISAKLNLHSPAALTLYAVMHGLL